MSRAKTNADLVARIRAICMTLPEGTEQPFGGHTAPSFRVRDKLFVTIHEDLSALVCKAAPGVQQALVGSDPSRFFIPAYVGNKGWVGVRLDGNPDWNEIEELIEDSYRIIAPKRLSAQLDGKAQS